MRIMGAVLRAAEAATAVVLAAKTLSPALGLALPGAPGNTVLLLAAGLAALLAVTGAHTLLALLLALPAGYTTAVKGEAGGLAAIPLGLAALSALHLLARREGLHEGRARVDCAASCVAIAVASTAGSLALVGLAAYGLLVVAKALLAWPAEAAAEAPPRLAVLLETLAHSSIYRLLTAALLLAAAAWLLGGQVPGLVYAATAPPRELRRLLRERIVEEARRTVEQREWHHLASRRRLLSILLTPPTAVAAYGVVALTPLHGALGYAASLAAGYTASRTIVGYAAKTLRSQLNWRKAAKAGTALLAAATLAAVLAATANGEPPLQPLQQLLQATQGEPIAEPLPELGAALEAVAQQVEHTYRLLDTAASILLGILLG